MYYLSKAHSCLFLFAAFFLFASIPQTLSTPLDDYVNTPDPHYNWVPIISYERDNYTLYILNLTSQKWYDANFSNRFIWWHYLCVTVPKKVTLPESSLIYVSGGAMFNDIPKPEDDFITEIAKFAVKTGSITAVLRQIPNQPLVFNADPTQMNRTEDSTIAWTWKIFLEDPSDPYVLLRMPMTKAVVRAMDAVQEFAKKTQNIDIYKFMIGGESKRGWTTWTTAAVDSRVVIATPVVMDIANLNNALHRHYRALGGWSFAFLPYSMLNVTKHMDTSQMLQMEEIIDPSSYFDRFVNKTIMVVTASGDEDFLHEDTYTFWGDLVKATNGRALFKRLPNDDHYCNNHSVTLYSNLSSLYLSVFMKQKLPKLHWNLINTPTYGSIQLFVNIVEGAIPSIVRIYFADTMDNIRRDFRAYIFDPVHKKGKLNPIEWFATTDNITVTKTETLWTYEYQMANPKSGWRGFFFEIEYPDLSNDKLIVSTETNIVPDYYPFPDCFQDECALGPTV